MGAYIPQATIDKLTDQIIANILPILKSSVSQAIANALADIPLPTPAPIPIPIPDPSIMGPSVVKPDIGNAQWIWTNEKAFAQSPSCPRAFRKELGFNAELDSMVIDITCDNWYTLYVNGRVVGNGNAWNVVKRYSIIFPRTNHVAIAVYAANHPLDHLTAGLIASAVVWDSTDNNGHTFNINTGSTWKASVSAVASGLKGFEQCHYADLTWPYAIVRGPYGEAPWGAIVKPTATSPVTGGFSGPRRILDPLSAPLATPGPDTSHGSIGPNPLAQLDGAD